MSQLPPLTFGPGELTRDGAGDREWRILNNFQNNLLNNIFTGLAGLPAEYVVSITETYDDGAWTITIDVEERPDYTINRHEVALTINWAQVDGSATFPSSFTFAPGTLQVCSDNHWSPMNALQRGIIERALDADPSLFVVTNTYTSGVWTISVTALNEVPQPPDMVTLRTVWVGFPEGMQNNLEREFERANLVWCTDAESFVGINGDVLANRIVAGILAVSSTDTDVYTLTVTNVYDGEGNWTITVTRADVEVAPTTLRVYFYNVGSDSTTRVAYLPPVDFTGELAPTINDITFPAGVPASGWVFDSYTVELDADDNWVMTVNFVPAEDTGNDNGVNDVGNDTPINDVAANDTGNDDGANDTGNDDGANDAGNDDDVDTGAGTTSDARRTPASGPKTGDANNFFTQIAAFAALVTTKAIAGLVRTREQS
jgi:hypothetical protein